MARIFIGLLIILLVNCSKARGVENRVFRIEPSVNYLTASPVIDGKLDDFLHFLPVHSFRFQEKHRSEKPIAEPTYRLAYGAEFFYLFIEIAGDSLICRDRGYQNGDGFHMVFAIPDSGSRETDEFYVLAFSPQQNPGRAWQRKFIWYRNRELSFRRLKDSRLRVRVKDGKIGFEVLIPWKEIYPYHPWHCEQMGFNLCYVQAIKGGDKNYYYIVADKRMQSEQSPRLWAKLKFEPPIPGQGIQMYSLLERNHFPIGINLRVKLAVLGSDTGSEMLKYSIIGEQGESFRSGELNLLVQRGLSHTQFSLPTADLSGGDYRLRLPGPKASSVQEIPFTILPAVDVRHWEEKLLQVKNHLSSGSYSTLLFHLGEIRRDLAQLKPYDTAGKLRKKLEDFLFPLNEAVKKKDVIAMRTGLLRRAYRSKIDYTLQPYTVKIPGIISCGRKFPLLVFLHGSGTNDHKALQKWQDTIPDSFIGLAPFGRGTSNVFSSGLSQQDIQEAIDDVIAHYPVDTSRIVLAGFSMGGYGVYRTFWEQAKRFRALAVFSGHPDLANRWGVSGTHPNFLQSENLTVFKDVPIFIFHGEQDRNCPFELTEKLVDALKQAGAKVTFCLEKDKGHEFPGKTVLRRYDRWLQEVTGAQ